MMIQAQKLWDTVWERRRVRIAERASEDRKTYSQHRQNNYIHSTNAYGFTNLEAPSTPVTSSNEDTHLQDTVPILSNSSIPGPDVGIPRIAPPNPSSRNIIALQAISSAIPVIGARIGQKMISAMTDTLSD